MLRDYLTILLFLLSVACSIFCVSHSFVDNYIVTQLLCPVYILLAGILVWLPGNGESGKTSDFMLLLLCALLLAGLFRYPSDRLPYFFFLFLSVGYILDKTRKAPYFHRYMVGGLSAIGSVEALWGVAQHFHVLPNTAYHLVTGTFDNPAGFAICLSLLSPFSMSLSKVFPSFRSCIGYSFFALSGCAILLSASRTGILAWTSVLVLHLYFSVLCRRISSACRRRMLCVGAFSAMAFLLVLYFWKRDSADGRLLIWRVAWNMIQDAPWTGHGNCGFESRYMFYQAEYFRQNPESLFARLADNVLYPFNEFLKIGVEYGVVGLCVLAMLASLFIVSYRKSEAPLKPVALQVMLVLMICACFSYPLKYPVTWIVAGTAFSLAGGWKLLDIPIGIPYLKWGAVTCIAVTMAFLARYIRAELQWKKTVVCALGGKVESVFPRYESLSARLGTNGLFLYNYAAELYVAGHYDKCLETLDRCVRYKNDYDIQLLYANCYNQTGRSKQAMDSFLLASQMCPNRFLPLYRLVLLYDAAGEKEKALAIARDILHKKIKVPSMKVRYIINEMKDYVKRNE